MNIESTNPASIMMKYDIEGQLNIAVKIALCFKNSRFLFKMIVFWMSSNSGESLIWK